jgi:prophage DNA circulation protein
MKDFGNASNVYPALTPAPNSGAKSREQQDIDRAAIIGYFRSRSVCKAVQSLARTAFATQEEALEMQDRLDTAIGTTLTHLANEEQELDEMYDAVRALIPAMVDAANTLGAGLPTTRTVSVNDFRPTIIWSYKLYDDTEHDSDIAIRNLGNSLNPAFMIGDVEVLTEDSE